MEMQNLLSHCTPKKSGQERLVSRSLFSSWTLSYGNVNSICTYSQLPLDEHLVKADTDLSKADTLELVPTVFQSFTSCLSKAISLRRTVRAGLERVCLIGNWLYSVGSGALGILTAGEMHVLGLARCSGSGGYLMDRASVTLAILILITKYLSYPLKEEAFIICTMRGYMQLYIWHLWQAFWCNSH